MKVDLVCTHRCLAVELLGLDMLEVSRNTDGTGRAFRFSSI